MTDSHPWNCGYYSIDLSKRAGAEAPIVVAAVFESDNSVAVHFAAVAVECLKYPQLCCHCIHTSRPF